jgi:DnaK suppressor protein
VRIDPASGLSEEQVTFLRGKLLQAREAILSTQERWRPPAQGDPLERGEVQGDAADQAQLSFEQAISSELGEVDHRRAKEIDDALARIEEGRYGVCEGTGEPIGLDRLSIQPWARYTTAYQQKLETQYLPGPPPRL